MSVRRAVARPVGTGDLLEDVVDFEASTVLAEQQKVALRLHRAFLTHPAGLAPDVRAQALAHFVPAQIVELAFKFVWWSTNRATVTLGDDAPHDVDRLTSFHYDEQGRYVVHAGE
jgi:alkylhydroperoxidase family enzyme